ncbi:MAG: translocation/assembly module TamB domain-containing protein, partial [Gammaproteobacteria bacterium]|nr:translocation/assembly module TamB domain-containing protein [Gammaproteobacteria bacterium]
QVQHNLDAPYEIETTGTLTLIENALSVDLSNTWRQIKIERGDTTTIQAADGVLKLIGPLSDLAFDGASTISTADVPAIAVETRGRLVGDRIDFESLSAANEWARLVADGELLLSPQVSWRFDVELSELDPAVVDDRLNGKLEIIGNASGRLEEGQPLLDFDIGGIGGELNGHPVEGSGKLSFADERLRFDDAVIRVGDNRANLDGSFGKQLELNARVRLLDLSQFGLGAAGLINSDLRLVSDPKTFQASGNIRGEKLGWQDYAVDTLDAEFNLPVTGDGRVDLQLFSAEQGSIAAEIDGRFADDQWNGTVQELVVRRELLGEWTLGEPTEFSLSKARLKLGQLCLSDHSIDGAVCAALDYDFSGPLEFESSINGLPLSGLPQSLPAGASILGVINASASGSFANRQLDANANLQIDGLALVATFEGDEVAASFEEASVNASVVDNKLVGEFEFRLDDATDHAIGSLEIADLFDPGSPIAGRATMEFDDLALASFFAPDLANPVGRIFGRLDATGSLVAPQFAGELGLSNGSVDIRRAGVSVTEVELLLRQSKAGELAISGSAKSGDGFLNIKGQTSLGAQKGVRTEIRLDGENFTLVRLPDMRATASPAIDVVFDERTTRVSGSLGIPEASITVRSVPQTTQRSSADAVVHRGDAATETSRRMLFVDVTTELGEQVFFSGFGLTTGLDGSVRISGDSQSPFQGFGRLVLREGRYQAYGQNLEIESGELVFNGPLTNPALNVRATRTASDNTVAGIHLTGTPTSLSSEVYSEPPLGDADALSYLLTGRPLINANSEEGDMLNQAAFALGLTTAGSVASRVRNQLGLETLGIQGDAENRQLVAGKRFGDRLFIEYAYGVVDSLGTLLLRYQLTRRLMVESRSGSVRNVDVVYSVRKE